MNGVMNIINNPKKHGTVTDRLIKELGDRKQNTCYIVGGGPSLKDFDWNLLEGKFTVAINRAYEKLPDASIVYFTDNDWWITHKTNLVNHSAVKVKGSLNSRIINSRHVIEYLLTGETGIETNPNHLKHGRNSTYAAINMIGVHLNVKEIYLLGIDLKRGVKGETHWHSGHKRIDPPQVFKIMTRNFNTIAQPLTARGIKIINVNTQTGTNLRNFPIKSIKEVFNN